jgi:[ribosomal protein S18]-alanine N-acetyltransferase
MLRVVEHVRVSDMWAGRLVVRSLTVADARQIAQWRYGGRWRVYDARPEDGLLNPDDGYLAVVGADDGLLVGFCCSGVEARVPGLVAAPGLVDVGVGMDPAFVGAGHGLAFGQAILGYFRQAYGAVGLRAVVQAWNERSLRLTQKLGFVEEGRHVCVQDGAEADYVVLIAR